MKTLSVFSLTAIILSLVSSQIPDVSDVPPPPTEEEIIETIPSFEDEWVGVAPLPPDEKTESEKEYTDILMGLISNNDKCFMTTINVDEWKLVVIILPKD